MINISFFLIYFLVCMAVMFYFAKFMIAEHNEVVEELNRQKKEYDAKLKEMADIHNAWAQIVENHENGLRKHDEVLQRIVKS